MMSPETRSFYSGYRLLTGILPVYVLTALFFLAGWYLNPLRPGLGGFLFIGLVIFLGISRIVGWLGFLLVNLSRKVVQPDQSQAAKLSTALEPFDAAIEPQLIEIGNVPFLAAGGRRIPTVWISTHTLGRLEADELGCLMVHEGEHLNEGSGLAWWDLLWLLPVMLGAGYHEFPAMFAAATVLYAWTWLRLQGWLRFREEIRADQAAARSCGREQYARAMVRHLAEFETVPDSPLRRPRLAALGFSKPETEELLRDNAHSSSVP